MTYPNLTDEDIQKLRDAISNALGNMKSDIRKDKLKVFGKTLLSLIIVAGGVAVSVIFPNPITIGVLGGAATLIAGNKYNICLRIGILCLPSCVLVTIRKLAMAKVQEICTAKIKLLL